MGNPTYARITVVITRLRCRLQRHSTPFEQAPDRPSRVEAGRHAAVGRVCNPWPISHTFRRLAPALAFAFGRTGSLSDASSETSTSESFSDSDESDEARFLLFLRAIAGELFTKNEQVEKGIGPWILLPGRKVSGRTGLTETASMLINSLRAPTVIGDGRWQTTNLPALQTNLPSFRVPLATVIPPPVTFVSRMLCWHGTAQQKSFAAHGARKAGRGTNSQVTCSSRRSRDLQTPP